MLLVILALWRDDRNNILDLIHLSTMTKKEEQALLIFERKIFRRIYGADRLCGLVVRVSGYRYRGLGFDSRRYQIFWVVVGLERGPLSLVRSIEELFE